MTARAGRTTTTPPRHRRPRRTAQICPPAGRPPITECGLTHDAETPAEYELAGVGPVVEGRRTQISQLWAPSDGWVIGVPFHPVPWAGKITCEGAGERGWQDGRLWTPLFICR